MKGKYVDAPVVVEANARLDFAGPWVDVDPWRRELGQQGATVNVPISLKAVVEVRWRASQLRVSGPSGSRLVSATDDLVVLHAKDTDARAKIRASDVENIEVHSSLALAQAAVLKIGLEGVEITTCSDAPPGSGVGSSSCMAVAIVKALSLLNGGEMTLEEIIWLAREIETTNLGISGGWQDYYPAAYGRGIHFMVWEGGADGGNLHEQVRVSPGFVDRINSSMVVVYSGRSRLSGNIHSHVYGALRSDKLGVRAAFEAMTKQAQAARDAFRLGNFGTLCRTVNDSWHCQEQLHESVTNEDITGLFNCAFDNGAAAGKACGAGGGGCVFFLAEPPDLRPKLVEAIEKQIKNPELSDAHVLDCKIVT